MTHLTITLPDAAKAYIDRQISSGTYNSADEFLTALIEQDRERQAKQKVNAMLRSALQKNKAIEATDEWWEQQLPYLIEHLETLAGIQQGFDELNEGQTQPIGDFIREMQHKYDISG